ncbi:MAG: DUF1566 domain-containing protein [Candidatus Binatia bacterium]
MRRREWLALLATLVLVAAPVHAISDADKCEAAKNKIAGKYAFCRQKAEAKAIKKGMVPDFSQCDAKFGPKWIDAETTGGGMCPTNGDQSATQSCITAHANEVAAALMSGGTCGSGGLPRTGQTQCDQGAGILGACPGSPAGQDGAVLAGAPRNYTDNGDGTVTDNVTGLMWEKLSVDGSIHDVNAFYNWSAAFTTKIATLNSLSFAGYNDWRLPNRLELETLVDAGRTSPCIDPAFNTGCAGGCTVTTCSCTQTDTYWSSTTYKSTPTSAWQVYFNLGDVIGSPKTATHYVRAVRGSS